MSRLFTVSFLKLDPEKLGVWTWGLEIHRIGFDLELGVLRIRRKKREL